MGPPASAALPVAVIGTAGHIDHGKSALVRALTGTDPDRLPEEKRRGITIQLGYAWLDLPSGSRVSVVDVPGHERFIRTMAQGASVIQAAVLVVDANEGVKPQTVEHLHILRSMGVRRGLVALTKCDTAPPDLQELAADEARELVRGTFLDGAPVLPTSAVTGAGLPELVRELDRVAGELRRGLEELPARVPLDRVFTVAGFGTVVTGTLVGGLLREGDEVLLAPSMARAKLRGIEVHEVKTAEARAPCRIALNLSGVDASQKLRGQWAVLPGDFVETAGMLAGIEGMPWLTKELRLPARLSASIGTASIPCRLFAAGALGAGGKKIARVALGEPAIARAGDRFILRLEGGLAGGYSTVASGVVLDPLLRGSRLTPAHLEAYGRHEEMTPREHLAAAIRLGGRRGTSRQEALLRCPAAPRETERLLGALAREGLAVEAADGTVFDGALHAAGLAAARRELEAFHAASPELAGVKREELARRVAAACPGKLFEKIARDLVAAGEWEAGGDLLRRAGHAPRGDDATAQVASRIEALIAAAPSAPPSLDEVRAAVGGPRDLVERGMRYLTARGAAKVIDGQFLYSTAFLDELARRVDAFFETHAELKVPDLKEIAGVSRKYAIPLAHWLDDSGLTIRRGDTRMKRKG